VADIGLQGSTLRTRGAGGESLGKIEAYEMYLRGTLGEEATIGRPIVRRIPHQDARFYVERLVRSYLDGRLPDETFTQFTTRHADEELIAIASDRPVEVVAEELAAKARRGVREPVEV
jgi:ferredoxin-nitrite reductase